MGLLADFARYGRFSWQLRRFLRQRMTLEQARSILQRRLANRGPGFLRIARHGIYGNPHSPYLGLLKYAGCEFGDLEREVRTQGLEGTLRALRASGVYLTFEEFKGRTAVIRGGQEFPIRPDQFQNPHLGAYYYGQSGGSTGTATRVAVDLEHLTDQIPMNLIRNHVHGVLDAPTILWRGILPDSTGINNVLRPAPFGQVPVRWFTPPLSRGMARQPLLTRLATPYIVYLARLYGARIPKPEPASLDEALIIARAIAEALVSHGACLVRAHVSMSLRICLAARQAGLDLTGATFMGGGEPPTPGKVREIRQTGATWVPTYVFTEGDHVGLGCVRPADGNDLHFLKHSLALIQHPRSVPGAARPVDAFCFTSLSPAAPKILLNVESDDYGVVEKSSCGCPLEQMGFTEHLRHVRSFSKLTGEGVTLVGSEMIHILEEVLPARWGGTAQDYQLMEEEDEQGFTRLTLLIDPKVRLDDEAVVLETVLDALGGGSVAADLSQALWRQARTLRVKRASPVWTERGKLLPLHLARGTRRSGPR